MKKDPRPPRDFWAKEQYPGQPVKCPECCKLYSAARLKNHLGTKHHIY